MKTHAIITLLSGVFIMTASTAMAQYREPYERNN